jgi:hypothetical protein
LGYSYSQIKKELGTPKGTLAGWLKDLPLSEERIMELKQSGHRSVEKFRNTMLRKRENRLEKVFKKVSDDIGKLTNRELFLSGLFLYWGEGWKTNSCTTALTNTNPKMIRFFIKWLEFVGVKRERIKIHLHLYSDMDIQSAIEYWVKELGIPCSQFRNPYIKKSMQSSITYKAGFGRGTCNVIFENRDLSEYVMMGLKYIQTL